MSKVHSDIKVARVLITARAVIIIEQEGRRQWAGCVLPLDTGNGGTYIGDTSEGELLRRALQIEREKDYRADRKERLHRAVKLLLEAIE